MANGILQPTQGSPFRPNVGAETIQGIGNILQQFQAGQQLAKQRQQQDQLLKQQRQSQILQDALTQAQTVNAQAQAIQRLRPPATQQATKFVESVGEDGEPVTQLIDSQGQVLATFAKPVDQLAIEKTKAETEATQALTEQRRRPQETTPQQELASLRMSIALPLLVKRQQNTITPEEEKQLFSLIGAGGGVTINNLLEKPASPSEREAIATNRATLDSLENLERLFVESGAESQVGLVSGRIAQIKDIFGQNEPALSSFLAASAAFKNQVIKEITGAQMSEKEAKRIQKQLPLPTDPPVVWRAKMEQSKQNLERIRQRRSEVLRQSGIKVPEQSSPTQGSTRAVTVQSVADKFGL